MRGLLPLADPVERFWRKKGLSGNPVSVRERDRKAKEEHYGSKMPVPTGC